LKLFEYGKQYLEIDGLLLLNYLIILRLEKKYKENELMRMLSCIIFGALVHTFAP
jgi:hypothetical protein